MKHIKFIKILGGIFGLALALGTINIVKADISNPHPTPPTNSVSTAMLQAGAVTDNEVNSNAAIDSTKLNLGSIVVGSIVASTSAQIATSTIFHILAGNITATGTVTATNVNSNGDLTVGGNLNITGSCANCGLNEVDIPYVSGDPLYSGDAVYQATSSESYTAFTTTGSCGGTGNAAFGLVTPGTNNSIKAAASFVKAAPFNFNKITACLGAAGTPTDSLVLSIQDDVNGVPSGVDVASTTLAAASIAAGFNNYTMWLPTNHFQKNHQFWVVGTRTGALDDTNFYYFSSASNGGAGNGGTKLWNGSSWGGYNGGAGGAFSFNYVTTANSIYRASAADNDLAHLFIGFSTNYFASTTRVFVAEAGTARGFTGITPSATYYLSNIAGAIGAIGVSSSTMKVGTGSTASSILITNVW